MEKYNYFEAMINDIINYIKENQIDFYKLDDDLDKQQELEDKLFNEDSITGNASGSYFCNAWKAEEAICHNMNLAKEAYEEFGYENIRDYDAESIDVTIRCYLLPQTLHDAIQRLINEDCEKVAQIQKELNEWEAFPKNGFRVKASYELIHVYCRYAIGEWDLVHLKLAIKKHFNLHSDYRDWQTFFLAIEGDEIAIWARINRA